MRRPTTERELESAAELTLLGSQLRELREAQGLSYDDIAEATHVRPHVLRAIEEGRVEEVAAPVYARGFIKTYCEYLMAMDLWKKYSQNLPSPEIPKSGDRNRGAAMDINHPTPMFRRSSIIWVYFILIVAVLGAAFLLWNQHMKPGDEGSGFFLRLPEQIPSAPPIVRSQDVEEGPAQDLQTAVVQPSFDALPISPEVIPASGNLPGLPIVSGDPVSSDAAPPRSSEPRQVDLSWLDGAEAPPPLVPQIPEVIQQVPDQRLHIEITGTNRLVVQQRGTVITRRNLTAGGTRSYDVTSDTTVSFSVGNAADVTWFGKRYERIGGDGGALSLIFHPDGRVTVTGGSSPYFGGDRQPGRPNPGGDGR